MTAAISVWPLLKRENRNGEKSSDGMTLLECHVSVKLFLCPVVSA